MNSQTKLSSEQEAAIEIIESGQNVFLTGKAGSGKSTIIQEFLRRTNRNFICVAPTGVAARNVGGTTVHGAFGLPTGLLTPDTITNASLKVGQIEVLRTVDTVVIDEISMVRSDLLWGMDIILRELAPPEMKHFPFGGKQVVAVGDFFQLPPVVADRNIELRYLNENHGGIFAFNTDAWKHANFIKMILKEFHRQDQYDALIEIAEYIRSRSSVDRRAQKHLEILNQRFTGTKYVNEPGCVSLCALKRDARMINDLRTGELDDPGFISQATLNGRFPQGEFPTDYFLTVKKGQRVMLLKNKVNSADEGFKYVNGDTGTVVGYKVGESPKVSVILDRGGEVVVGFEAWDYDEYCVFDSGNGEQAIMTKTVGRFHQLPLVANYGITVHKSQGRTLKRAHFIPAHYGCYTPGLLYTALTRVRSLNDLTISDRIHDFEALSDSAVLQFYNA